MIQKGDLVRFITHTFNVDKETLGIVTGYHPTNGRVKVSWIAPDRFGPLLPAGIAAAGGYWTYGSLKVISGKVASSYSLACQTTKKAN